MGDASQQIMGPLIKLIRPEVRDVWAYYEAGFHNLLVVSVEARYTREPVRTAMGILGEGQLGLSKVVVMVDASVDVKSFPRVLDAIRTHFQPRQNFHLISNAPLDTLDFTSFKLHHGSRMILDATGSKAQYSGGDPVNTFSQTGDSGRISLGADPAERAPHVKRSRLWNDSLLVVQADRVEENIGRKVIEPLVASDDFANVKMIAVVSPDVDINDDVDLIWGVFTRFDPARDVVFASSKLSGIQPIYDGVMGIDATWKPGYPDAVEPLPETTKLVDSRWKEYGFE